MASRSAFLQRVPVLFAVLLLFAGSGSGSNDEILIVLCELTGPDREIYQVNEALQQWLEVLYSDYGDITVERSTSSFTFDQSDYSDGAAAAQAEGVARGADMVFWGAYMVEGTRMRIAFVTQNTMHYFEDPLMGTSTRIFTRDESFPISDVAPTDSPPDIFASNAYHILSFVFSSRGEYQTALELLNRALSLAEGTSVTDAAILLGARSEFYFNVLGDEESALEDIDRAIALEPGFSAFYNLKEQIISGEGAENDDRLGTPLTGFQEGSFEDLYSRAVALDLAGRFEEALEYYDAAIALGSEDVYMAAIYVDRSMCNSYLENYQQAIEDAHTALEYNPRDVLAYARLSEVAELMGDYDACIRHLSAGIEVDPESAYLLGNRARIYYGVYGNLEEASDDALLALENAPGDPSLLFLMGEISGRLGNVQEAIDYTGEAILNDPGSSSMVAYYTVFRALCHMELGEIDAAMEDLDTAVATDPGCVKAYYYRGLLNMHNGDNGEAAWDFRKVLELSSDETLGARAQEYLDQMGF